jgi:hypothetical protein
MANSSRGRSRVKTPSDNGEAAHVNDSGKAAADEVQKSADGTNPLAAYERPPEPPPTIVPDPATQLKDYLSGSRVAPDGSPPPAQRVTALQVKKPYSDEFVRVRPDDEQHVFNLFKPKSGQRLYLVKPGVEAYLPANQVRPYRLVLAIHLNATVPFIWPLCVPQDDFGYQWHFSAEQSAQAAVERWIQVRNAGDSYVAYPAPEEHPAPLWTPQTLAELIWIAFTNSRIDSPDHPAVKRYQGRK